MKNLSIVLSIILLTSCNNEKIGPGCRKIKDKYGKENYMHVNKCRVIYNKRGKRVARECGLPFTNHDVIRETDE